MWVDGEPKRKGQGGKRSAVAFQLQVIDWMERYRRYPFTGPVALDLQFVATRRNPPIIHHAAKHTLDVLGRTLPENIRPRRRSVLYRDDRQVKFLYVDLDQAWEPAGEGAESRREASTWLTARPARDVVTDLRIANRLRDYEDDYDVGTDGSNPFWTPELPEDLDLDWLPHRGERVEELTPLQRFLEQSARFWYVHEMQEAILARTDAVLVSGLCMHLDQRSSPEPPEGFQLLFPDAHEVGRGLLLSNPLTLPLPGLPQASGASKEFAQLIRDRLQDFLTRHPLFNSLVVPVKLTFLVVPPEQGKDLDNIALTALPIAHEVLKPHIEPHLLAPTYEEDSSEPFESHLLGPPCQEDPPKHWRQEALDRLRSLNANSVTAYQVIELPRSPEDPPEGVLRLALGRDSRSSWWEQAANYIEKKVEQAEEQSAFDTYR
jgi:hypothetical protein